MLEMQNDHEDSEMQSDRDQEKSEREQEKAEREQEKRDANRKREKNRARIKDRCGALKNAMTTGAKRWMTGTTKKRARSL